jgi:hypothetical protein
MPWRYTFQVRKLLVGTKCDLESKRVVDKARGQQVLAPPSHHFVTDFFSS